MKMVKGKIQNFKTIWVLADSRILFKLVLYIYEGLNGVPLKSLISSIWIKKNR